MGASTPDGPDAASLPAGGAWHVRPARGEADLPALRAMLYEAAYWRPGAPRPPLEAALADPRLARYIDAWGRAGDTAVIAEASDAGPIGAAWFRLFSADEPGYGFVDAATPELALAVAPEWRRQGIGSACLAALLDTARRAGCAAVSLSVEMENPALALYRRHGFVPVGQSGAAWTMVASLR